MLKKPEYYSVIGLVAMLLDRRRTLDELEEVAAEVLKNMGAKDSDTYHTVLSDIQEIVYNNNANDNPAEATKELLERLKLGVEE